MNKIYVLAPLAGLLLFGAYHWKYSQWHDARVAAIRELDQLAREKQRVQEAAARAAAMAQAEQTLARRKQEREEKERVEAAQKQTRLDLEQRRNLALEQAHRLRPQVDRLKSELATADAALTRAEERIHELRQERTFLVDYVKQAEANRNAFHYLLEQLEVIERNRSAAAESAVDVSARANKS